MEEGLDYIHVHVSLPLGITISCSQALSSKRYDLEGFAEYARQLHASQTFHQAESGNISYVLRVHSILLRQGVEVTTGDKVGRKRVL